MLITQEAALLVSSCPTGWHWTCVHVRVRAHKHTHMQAFISCISLPLSLSLIFHHKLLSFPFVLVWSCMPWFTDPPGCPMFPWGHKDSAGGGGGVSVFIGRHRQTSTCWRVPSSMLLVHKPHLCLCDSECSRVALCDVWGVENVPLFSGEQKKDSEKISGGWMLWTKWNWVSVLGASWSIDEEFPKSQCGVWIVAEVLF